MKVRKIFWCFILCYFGCQEYSFASHLVRHIDDAGLVSKTIHSIYQDEDGYLWIGTQSGAFVFNGTEFKLPYNFQGSIQSPIASVCALNGTYWLSFGNENAALVSGRSPKTISRGHLWPTAPFVRGNDTFLLSTSTYRVHLDNEDTSMATFISEDFQLGDRTSLLPDIRGISQRSLDSVIVATSKGIFLYTYGLFEPLGPKRLSLMEFHAISNNEKGIWIGSKEWVYRLSEKGRPIDSIVNPSKEQIMSIAYSKKAGLWFSTASKKLFWHKDGLTKDVSESAGVPRVLVNQVFIDRNEDVWLGTNGAGLVQVLTGPFHHINIADGIKDNWLKYQLRVSDSEHLLLTSGGLSVWNDSMKAANGRYNEYANHYCYEAISLSQNQHVLALQHADKSQLPKLFTIENREFYSVPATTLLQIDSTKFIYGQHSGDVFSYDIHTKVKSERVPFFPASISSIAMVSDSLLFIGTRRGMRFMNPEKMVKLDPKGRIPKTFELLNERRIYQLLPLKDKSILAVYNGGIARYVDGEWKNATPAKASNGLLYTCAAESEDGRLFLGHQKGILIVEGDSISEIGLQHGLPSQQVHYLSIDPLKEILWIGTDQGIATLSLNRLSELTGPQPTLKLLSLELMPDSSLSYPWGELSLDHTNNDISIHFDVLNIRGLATAYGYYIINNLKNKWVRAENNTIDKYNLSPGTYTVWTAAGYSENGLKPGNPFVFTIRPPFWRTPLGIGIYVSVFLLLVVVLVMLRIRYIRRTEYEKRKVMTQIHVLQQQSMTAMMNPHFIFNALNAVQNFALRHKDRVASQFIADLAKFIRTQMHMLEKKTILLKDEMAQLELYLQLESKRFDDAFRYEIKVDPKLVKLGAEIPPMLIQPFAENAIWHGLLPKDGIKRLNIAATYDGNEGMEVVVEDNGVGFQNPKDSSHLSRGISLIKKRLELHNDDAFEENLQIGTGENGGVKVRVKIRLNNIP